MVFVSTQTLMGASRASVMQAQASLSDAQQELSTGKLADVGLSLGTRSATVLSLNLEASRLQTLTDGNTTATTRLQATTSAIGTLQSTATTFLSALSTANPSSPALSSLLTTAQNNLGALTSVLNTTVAGQYIFGGINVTEPPMTAYSASPASANKQAVDASFQATFGFSQTSASATSVTADQMQSYLDTSFAALFADPAYGASWSAASSTAVSSQISTSQAADTSVTANEGPFRQIAQAYTMIQEFAGTNMNTAASQVVMNTAMTLVSKAIDGMTRVNAGVGVVQSTISDANDRMATQIGLLSGQSSTLQSSDSYALTTQISTLQTQIQASYEVTAKLQQLSLVNYLG